MDEVDGFRHHVRGAVLGPKTASLVLSACGRDTLRVLGPRLAYNQGNPVARLPRWMADAERRVDGCGLVMGDLLSLLFHEYCGLKELNLSANEKLAVTYLEAPPTTELETLYLDGCFLSLEQIKKFLRPFPQLAELSCGDMGVVVVSPDENRGTHRGVPAEVRTACARSVERAFALFSPANLVSGKMELLRFRNIGLEGIQFVEFVWNLLRDNVMLDLGENLGVGVQGPALLLLALRKAAREGSVEGAGAGVVPSEAEKSVEKSKRGAEKLVSWICKECPNCTSEFFNTPYNCIAA